MDARSEGFRGAPRDPGGRRFRLTMVALVFAGVLAAGAVALATVVTKPVTKGLARGAVFQAPVNKRSCYGTNSSVRLAGHRCTTLAQLKGVDPTVRPVVAADSRALFLPARSGVLVLERSSAGLSFGSCMPLVGPCGVAENDEGAVVSEIDLGPDGRHLYVLLNRERDNGTEIHAMAIGPDHGLSADPSCLLLIPPQTPGIQPPNPRGCRVETADNHAGASSLTFTPNGRFAYLVAGTERQLGASIVELARAGDGSLSVLPGCVSGSGDRDGTGTGTGTGKCETTLPTAQSDSQYLVIRQVAATPDGSGLVARGDDSKTPDTRTFLVRFAIGADGSLARSNSPSACVNAMGTMGCAKSGAIFELASPIAVAGNRVYIGTHKQFGGPQSLILDANVLGYVLSSDGGLALPSGRSGCAANRTKQYTRIKRLGTCSVGREAMRNPAHLLAGPRNTLYVVSYLAGDSRGIALFKLGAGGAPAPVSGPSGCYVDTTLFTKEKTPCNAPFTPGTLANAEYTFTLAPDGRAAYVLEQVRAFTTDRLTVLQVAR